jgi:hypothetical protein
VRHRRQFQAGQVRPGPDFVSFGTDRVKLPRVELFLAAGGPVLFRPSAIAALGVIAAPDLFPAIFVDARSVDFESDILEPAVSFNQ